MRVAIVMSLVLLLASLGCNKKSKEPAGPNKGEVYAKHKDAGLLQLQSLQAIFPLIVREPPLSMESLAQLPTKLPVSDIVLNKSDDEHSGNARLFLLDELLKKTSDAKDLGVMDHFRAYRRITAPAYPTGFHPGSFNEVLVRPARFLQKAPANANDELSEKYRLMVEEFVGLKYLLVLRTIALKAPQEIKPNVYTPGIYGGQLMVFDLQARQLIATVPVLTSNKAGKTSTGPKYDLGNEVEQVVDTLLKTSGATAAATP